MAATKKTITAAVFHPSTGDGLGVITEFSFLGYSKELNAGPGECVLTIPKQFDYESALLSLNNEVELRIADVDTLTAGNVAEYASRVVYRGYISLVERTADPRSQSITVHLLGFYTKLATDILKSNTQTTLYSNSSTGLTITSGSQNAADIGLMMRAVIDQYRTETDNPKIHYKVDDIPLVGGSLNLATYRFEQKTYRDAIDALRKMAPENLYWYVNELGAASFKERPSTPTHVFISGKHFNSVRVEQSLEKVRNVLLLWDGVSGGTYKHYEDAASIALYGRRTHTLTAFGVDNSATADLIGAKFLAENKNPEIKVVCTILDNNAGDGIGYDIESIQPGDTCSFRGFATGTNDLFYDNMLITRVNYSLDKAVIEVQLIRSGLLDLQAQQQRDISDINSGGLGIPAVYT